MLPYTQHFPDLEIFGITMLEDLPPERDTVIKFAWEKFGYPQFTQYGDSFEVMNKSGPSNVAYTGKTLGLHLDQPIYTNRLERTFLVEKFLLLRLCTEFERV